MPHPKRGWNCPYEARDEEGGRSFKELDADGRIVWGEDERKGPQIKRFLHEQASFVSLSYLAFLWFLIGPQAPSAAENLIVGSLVMSLSFAGMLSLGQHIGYLKELQALDYYSALTTRGMLLSLPATLLIGFLAVVFFQVPFTGLSVLVLFLSAYAMAGFGALIGFYSPAAQVASLLTQILQTVIIPPSVLPEGLCLLAYLWPTPPRCAAKEASRSARRKYATPHSARRKNAS